MSQEDHSDKTSQVTTDSTAKKPVPGKSIDLLDEELTDEQLEAMAGGVRGNVVQPPTMVKGCN